VAGVRCFVGLPLPESWQEALARVAQRLAGALSSRISWTRPGNGHLTLKFLGDVAQERLPELVQALRGVSFSPFALAVGRSGPRALWIGLRLGEAESAKLAAQVGQVLEPLGFAPEKRPFAAHVTLGRVKALAPGDDWTLVERCVAGERWPVIEVDGFVLWRSVLGPGGPQYSRLAEFTSGGALGPAGPGRDRAAC